jgi:hypothetical protein
MGSLRAQGVCVGGGGGAWPGHIGGRWWVCRMLCAAISRDSTVAGRQPPVWHTTGGSHLWQQLRPARALPACLLLQHTQDSSRQGVRGMQLGCGGRNRTRLGNSGSRRGAAQGAQRTVRLNTRTRQQASEQ